MKKIFLSLTLGFFVTIIFPVHAGAGTRCASCRERNAQERKTLSIILSAIAQMANGLASIFGNPNNDMVRNEGVCNFVAGACTVASQASRSHGQESNPTDIYTMLSQPEVIAAIKKIVEDEALFTLASTQAQEIPDRNALDLIKVDQKAK